MNPAKTCLRHVLTGARPHDCHTHLLRLDCTIICGTVTLEGFIVLVDISVICGGEG